MHRQAEDLLLSNSHSHKGRAALKFILSLANDRSDAEDIKKGEKVNLYAPMGTRGAKDSHTFPTEGLKEIITLRFKPNHCVVWPTNQLFDF